MAEISKSPWPQVSSANTVALNTITLKSGDFRQCDMYCEDIINMDIIIVSNYSSTILVATMKSRQRKHADAVDIRDALFEISC